MRRGGSALLVALAFVGSLMTHGASATIDATDPDDVSSSFDIKRAESFSTDDITFRIRFYDELAWDRTSSLVIRLNTSGGGRPEYYIEVKLRHDGRIVCVLGSPHDAVRLPRVVWPSRITIVLPRSLIRVGHAIRWKVFAASREPGVGWVIDRAPDPLSEWYPHV